MANKKKKKPVDFMIPNKEVRRLYTLLDEMDAGIVLKGTEVKSIRRGSANLKGSYCFFKNNELFLKGMHVSPYPQAREDAHEPMRDKKLLLHRRELRKLQKAKEEKRYTIVVKHIFLNKKGLVKARLALAQGKNIHDKRITLKERDLARERERINKKFR
ncbi:MAG: SsrA-binding protein SmpB [Bacteroidota bacterium]